MLKLEPREFGRRTAEGQPCGHYDFSLYYGLRFACACGSEHDFKPWMEIVGELPLFKFIVICPDRGHMTVLKARWNRHAGSHHLESEMGTCLSEPLTAASTGIEFQAGLLEAKTGRAWSREETAALMEQQHGLGRIRNDGVKGV